MTALAWILAAAAAVLAALLARALARRRALADRLALYERAHAQLDIGLKIWRLEDPADPGSLRLLASNPAAGRATGVPIDEVIGKRIDEGFPETVRTGIAEAFADVARTGIPRHMGEVLYADARMTEAIYEVTCFPLPDRSVGVAFDNITRRRTVELQVERAASLIRLLADVAVAANAAGSAEEALQAAVSQVCRQQGWPVGHVYLPGADGSELRSTGIWHFTNGDRYDALRTATEGTRYAKGRGVPGAVLERGEPDWTIDATMEGDSARSRALRECGLRAALVFPILHGGRPTGVLEFFAPRAPVPDEELLNVMRQIGETLGHAVARSRADAPPG